MSKIYYEKECNTELIKNKKVTIIGYGSQGHAHALNLKDCGIDVRVALHEGSKSKDLAEKDGFKVGSVAELTPHSDLLVMLVSDHIQPGIYEKEIAPYIKKGKYLVFAHGFNIHYNQIKPGPEINVFMVAPKGPGHTVRSEYLRNRGVPCLAAIFQDVTGDTLDMALAYAASIGGAKAGVIETTFAEETETDLFGEQAVLCGGVTELIKAGFETLVEAGYQPEIAYYECLHELKLIVDMINQGGLSYMRYSISDTAEYGDYRAGNKIITAETRLAMKDILANVRDGSFASEWITENMANRPYFQAKRKLEQEHQIEKVGADLRKMMSWIKKP